MARQDAPPHFSSKADHDGDFDGAVPDPEVVAQAWDVWLAECAVTDQFVAEAPSLFITGTHSWDGQLISLREVLVHMVEEYAPAQRPRRPTARADRRKGGPVAPSLGCVASAVPPLTGCRGPRPGSTEHGAGYRYGGARRLWVSRARSYGYGGRADYGYGGRAAMALAGAPA
jgi:hypothetical protein